MSRRDADNCDACERDDALESHENAAALGTIDYRIGGYGRFLARMRGRISRQAIPPSEPTSTQRPLRTLTTRADDDPTFALLDAWACSLDVLTLYQEYIANEGFLRTAKERRSVLELARAIGYELAPGVAASTRLAFTLLDTPKAPREVELAVGTQVQSVPGPGELPQTFETVEAIVARPEHNAMLPQQLTPLKLDVGTDTIHLAGTGTGLRIGDRILLVGAARVTTPSSNRWAFRTVVDIDVDQARRSTKVRFTSALTSPLPTSPRVFGFRRSESIFGKSAPDPRMFSAATRTEIADLLDSSNEWKDFTAKADDLALDLVGDIPDVIPDGWIVLQDPSHTRLYGVEGASLSGRADFSLSLTTTRVSVDHGTGLTGFNPRSTIAYVASRELPLAEVPLESDVSGSQIALSGEVPAIERGRAVIVVGPDATTGQRRVEVALVKRTRVTGGRTVLILEAPLTGAFQREGTVILGNVARATHGKSVPREVVGSGDGSRPFQSFRLRQNPVTLVPSASGGAESTLSVRVNGALWSPVTSTWGYGPNDHIYVPRLDDDGETTLVFGDGVHGARLPTGSENVTVSYRVGIGSVGAVPADKLTILKTRPQGLKAATNPLPATGAEDPEKLADARINAPVTVLTLDRLVSVTDYEDYASAYPGIGKAQAVRLWDGRRWWVHLTLATSEGAPVDDTSDLHRSLTADIDAHRDPVQRVMFDTFVERRFRFRAKVRVDDAYLYEEVIESVKDVLTEAFSFEARTFGQAVTGAEIIALIHGVTGVVAMDLDALWYDGDPVPTDATSPASWILPADAAHWADTAVALGELLLLADDGADLSELRS